MRRLGMLVLLLLLLTGCNSSFLGGQTIIDWIDFVKWDGVEYNGIQTGALADKKYIDKKIGEVKFKVADNVNNPNYKTKNGDAAFHQKGTGLYSIKGYPNLLAIKDVNEFNGYRMYYANDGSEYQWHFKNVPIGKVKKVEIYKSEKKKIKELMEHEEVNRFLQILKDSKENAKFEYNTTNGDPTYYEMLLYTDGPVAYKFDLQYDGSTFFWHPWDTSILSNDIKNYIPEN